MWVQDFILSIRLEFDMAFYSIKQLGVLLPPPPPPWDAGPSGGLLCLVPISTYGFFLQKNNTTTETSFRSTVHHADVYATTPPKNLPVLTPFSFRKIKMGFLEAILIFRCVLLHIKLQCLPMFSTPYLTRSEGLLCLYELLKIRSC